jgi:hypothetical protein
MSFIIIIADLFMRVSINSLISCLADLLIKELITLAGVNNKIVADNDINNANIPVASCANKTRRNRIPMQIILAEKDNIKFRIFNLRFNSSFNKGFTAFYPFTSENYISLLRSLVFVCLVFL